MPTSIEPARTVAWELGPVLREPREAREFLSGYAFATVVACAAFAIAALLAL